MSDMEICEVCQGSGYSGHPDSGSLCSNCSGLGGGKAISIDGDALSLYIEIAAYLDSKLTHHDQQIVQHQDQSDKGGMRE